MSDRIAVMSEGRILQIGSPDDIYERPRNRFVADFIGQTNFLTGNVTGVESGIVTVDIAGIGLARGTAPAGSNPSGSVTLAVRPERLHLQTDLDGEIPAGWNRLSGTVTDVIYLGTHTQLVVSLPGEQSLIVHRQNQSGIGARGGLGDTVTVQFDPASATVLNA
jgi:spermidine/putrescine transport system ATP-binding protein